MDGAQARAGEHRKYGLRDHGHVDQHTVTLAHAQLAQHGGHALHFGVQRTEGNHLLGAGFTRHKDQRVLVRPLRQVAVHRVVAQVGGASRKPVGKRRTAVVQNLLRRGMPVD